MTNRGASLLLALLPTLALADSLPTDRYLTHQRPLDDLVAVPAGTFVMGATALNQSVALEMCRQQIGKKLERNCTVDRVAAETPADRTFVSAFHIDRVEVTIAAYRRCIAAGICDPQPIVQSDPRFVEDRLPITNVTHPEAERFCRWRGARLPTEAEWERAARGGDGRLFPWGNQPLKQAANLGKFTNIDGPVAPASTPVVQSDASDGFAFIAPVGSFPNGQSPFGVLDLAGNVAEWTADVFDGEPPQRRSRYNPHGPGTGEQRTVRGGSWRTPLFMARATTRTGTDPTERSSEIGFRCARNGD